MKRRKLLRSIAGSLIQTIAVLIGITLFTFFILHLSPKNPAEIWLVGTDGNVGQLSDETIRSQEIAMGLDRPFLVQYVDWLWELLHGNMGVSFTSKEPVVQVISRAMGPTAALAFISLSVTVVISVPLGIFCAWHKNGIWDNILRFFSFIGISLPSFLISLVFLWLFCLKLKIFPVIARNHPAGLVLPALVLIIQCSAKFIRQVRAAILDQLKQPYVLGARARGVSNPRILFFHVLKNALPLILTWISIYLGVMLGGAAIVETVFSWEGIGALAVEAVARLDYYVIQGVVLVIALIFLALNFIVDILCKIIDPRTAAGEGNI